MTDTLDYAVVDVFTDRAYAGNPLAVVFDADLLSTEQKQSIAQEFNLSETTFVRVAAAGGRAVTVSIAGGVAEVATGRIRVPST